MFGQSAPGYHAVNAVVFAATLIAVMLVLRRVGVPRQLAVAIPALFAVMPHYSTDRLWVAVFQANLSLALFAFATLLDLRAVESARRFIAWKLAGALALAGALLAYEIVGPLTLLTCVLLIRHAKRRPRGDPDRRITLALAACAIDLAVMAATAIWKSGVSDRLGVAGGPIDHLMHWQRVLFRQLLVFAGPYGGALPRTATTAALGLSATGLIASVLVATITFVYLSRLPRDAAERRVTRAIDVGTGGAMALALGVGVAAFSTHIGTHATGIGNRTAIVSSLGLAAMLAALLWPIGGPRRWKRVDLFALAIALLILPFSIVSNRIARYWTDASAAQHRIVDAIARADLEDADIVLLDDFCPYIGPGILFETSWDVTGMLRLVRGGTMEGDVVALGSALTDVGIRTTAYNDSIDYRYGEGLSIFAVDQASVHRIPDRATAETYFAFRSPARCDGRIGNGIDIFPPADRY
jgi:hypothetical protein